MTHQSFLPYGRQTIDEDDIAAVAEVLRSDYLTTGPAVEAFEKAFGEKVGARHAVVCSNGTAALHLAALALGLGPGDTAVVPTLTFLSTANALRFVGADVQFADVDPDSGLMTADTLLAALNTAREEGRAVKAVFVVHLNGQVAEMQVIAAIARERGLAVVEDSCHALGTTYRLSSGTEVQVGDCHFSDMAIFSFHAVKTIATGEGGMVTTNADDLAARLVLLRNHGMERNSAEFVDEEAAFDASEAVNPWYYEMHTVGYNYRLTDIQCALGLSQLRKLDRFAAQRRELARLYDARLVPLAPVVKPVSMVPDCDPCLHLYAVLVDFKAAGVSRRIVINRLREQGIGTQVHYRPVHQQPYYKRLYGERTLPGAEAYYDGVLSLPLFPSMASEDVLQVVSALGSVFSLPG